MNSAPGVDKLAPFIHVSDVDRSIAFYGKLGFAVTNRIDDRDGKACWAYLTSKAAELMLSRSSGPIDAGVQAVIFYHYCADVRAMREHLLKQGVPDGGRYSGTPMDPKVSDHSKAFEVTSPNWLPAGELRLHDPDGYVVMVGQLK
jgi:catechol 2,3-dioxygenase-like lactoylglutathione lyase family enzyme